MTHEPFSNNPFRRLVSLGLRIIEEERARKLVRPQRVISQAEYGELEREFHQLGAECRVIARKCPGWNAQDVNKAIADCNEALIGCFRPMPHDPPIEDLLEWSSRASNRFTDALVVVQQYADEYDAEQRFIAPGAMYVNRMRLLNVKPLHREIPEGGGAIPEPARRRLLLQGANGSGKTTILKVILTLWKFLGDWLERRVGPPSQKHLRHFLAQADLAAMEIMGIADLPPLWIGMGISDEWRALKETHPGALFAGLVHKRGKKEDWQIELPSVDLLTHRHRSLAGTESFPNVVYFRPDGRSIQKPKQPRAKILDTTIFNWAAVYHPTINLDSVLLTLKVHSPERFENCLRQVNLALAHRQKRITGFGMNGRLMVEGSTVGGRTYQHPIEELSSGEQQILLLVGFVVAFLRPGGIVLLDEPDLHIHMSMVTQLMETLELVVRERSGQLIVASHSERVWDWFTRESERIELTPWRGGK